MIERHIPNLITLANLFCGFLSILSCFYGDMAMAGIFIFAGGLMDLLDGMVARLLKSHSPIGADLDSLADVVTFGLAPAVIAHLLLAKSGADWVYDYWIGKIPLIPLLPFVITACGALRLAKFNVDTTQSYVFRGLPIPAAGLFFASLPLIMAYDPFILYQDKAVMAAWVLNPWLILGFSLLISWLMVSKLALFSFKRMGLPVYLLIGLSVALFAGLLFAAVPLIILLYVILSLIFKPKHDEIQRAD